MAKLSRSASARIATTVNARYFPASGIADAYFLDGRLTGRREARATDITVDRESRGFFMSVFAHPDETSQADGESKWYTSLQRLLQQIKTGNQDIDTEINDLADCAIDVTGRTMLYQDGARQPYFAGIIVKEAEVAAVTTAAGCAYLYRGDVLYPLTQDEFPLEAIDFNGNPIDRMEAFSSGTAGTVRYSNIAQLEESDCIMLCNKEVMEALGQREVLRFLYEAEDQSDAAGSIVTAAAAKLPGVPLQCMLAFVEQIIPAEKTGRLNLGRFQTGAIPTVSSAQPTPPSPPTDYAFKPQNSRGGFASSPANQTPFMPQREESKPNDQLYAPDPPSDTAEHQTVAYQPGSLSDSAAAMKAARAARSSEPVVEREFAETARSPLGESEYDAYAAGHMYGSQMRDQVPYGDEPYDDGYTDYSGYGGYDGYDDYMADDGYADNYSSGDGKARIRRIVFYVVLGLICIACVVALVRLIGGGGDKKTTKTTGPSVSVNVPIVQISDTTADATGGLVRPPTDPTTAPTLPPESADPGVDDDEEFVDETPDPGLDEPDDQGGAGVPVGGTTYIVEEGDTTYGIAEYFYGEGCAAHPED